MQFPACLFSKVLEEPKVVERHGATFFEALSLALPKVNRKTDNNENFE